MKRSIFAIVIVLGFLVIGASLPRTSSARGSANALDAVWLSPIYLTESLVDLSQRISPSGAVLNPSIAVDQNRMVMASVMEGKLLVTLSDDLRTIRGYTIEASSIDFSLKSITEVAIEKRGNALFLLALGLRASNQGRVYVLKSIDRGETFASVTFLRTRYNAPELYFGNIASLANGTLVFSFSYLYQGVEYCEEHDSYDGSNFVWIGPWYGDDNHVQSAKFQAAGSRIYEFWQQEMDTVTGQVILLARYSDDLRNWQGDLGPYNRYIRLFGDLEGQKVHGWIATAYDSTNQTIYVAYPERTENGSDVSYVSKKGSIWSKPVRLRDVEDGQSGFLPALASSNGRTFASWLDGRDNPLGFRAYGALIDQLGKTTKNLTIGEPFQIGVSGSGNSLGIKTAVTPYQGKFFSVWPQTDGLYARLN
jgi:hypothetical protein